eukprot:762997-Hanusia_phi.AAC.11
MILTFSSLHKNLNASRILSQETCLRQANESLCAMKVELQQLLINFCPAISEIEALLNQITADAYNFHIKRSGMLDALRKRIDVAALIRSDSQKEIDRLRLELKHRSEMPSPSSDSKRKHMAFF